ncbi:MAG: hypothetical protein IJQ81_17125 [Oscillibacter sp.]|nr:hypothetical protein [Oscillibacter sp.]
MYYRKKGPNVWLIVVALIVIIVAVALQNHQKSVSAQETAVKSWESAENSVSSSPSTSATFSYALNTNTMKIHKPNCSSVFEMADHNRQWTNKSIEELESEGYTKCKRCF